MWTGQDLNPPPPRCKRGALPDELPARLIKIFYLVGIPGFEPGTSTLSVLRSNQLSYMPSFKNIKNTYSDNI